MFEVLGVDITDITRFIQHYEEGTDNGSNPEGLELCNMPGVSLCPQLLPRHNTDINDSSGIYALTSCLSGSVMV